jgi:hypothetical protein
MIDGLLDSCVCLRQRLALARLSPIVFRAVHVTVDGEHQVSTARSTIDLLWGLTPFLHLTRHKL